MIIAPSVVAPGAKVEHNACNSLAERRCYAFGRPVPGESTGQGSPATMRRHQYMERRGTQVLGKSTQYFHHRSRCGCSSGRSQMGVKTRSNASRSSLTVNKCAKSRQSACAISPLRLKIGRDDGKTSGGVSIAGAMVNAFSNSDAVAKAENRMSI